MNGPKTSSDDPNKSVTEPKPQSQRAPAHTVNIDDEPTIVVQPMKDMILHETAVMELKAALSGTNKKVLRAARRAGIDLGEDEMLAMVH